MRIQHSSVLQTASKKPSTHNMNPPSTLLESALHTEAALPLVAALSHARVGPSRSRAAEDNDVT